MGSSEAGTGLPSVGPAEDSALAGRAGSWPAWSFAGSGYVLGIAFTAALLVAQGQALPWTRQAVLFAVGGAVLVACAARPGLVRRLGWAWLAALTAFGLVCATLIATEGLPTRPYGDGVVFAQFVADGRAVPRWLSGSVAAATLHAAVWELPAVHAALPPQLASPTAFLALLCVAASLGGTALLLWRWPGRLAVVLPMLTPVWVLFGSGYVEYYPLVAPAYVGALAWLFERPLERRSPRAIGILAGSLATLYVGFVPLAAAALGAFALARPRHAARAGGLALVVAAITIGVCWPEGLVSYVRTLYSVLNFGEAHIDPRYAGQVASPTSVFFSLDAAMSAARVRDVAYVVTWGGGWWGIPLAAVAAVRACRRGVPGWRAAEARTWLALGLSAWLLHYLWFMVPRLGPAADIDLLFPAYLFAAFLAGRLLDGDEGAPDSAGAATVLGLALATLACVGPALAWTGLPATP